MKCHRSSHRAHRQLAWQPSGEAELCALLNLQHHRCRDQGHREKVDMKKKITVNTFSRELYKWYIFHKPLSIYPPAMLTPEKQPG